MPKVLLEIWQCNISDETLAEIMQGIPPIVAKYLSTAEVTLEPAMVQVIPVELDHRSINSDNLMLDIRAHHTPIRAGAKEQNTKWIKEDFLEQLLRLGLRSYEVGVELTFPVGEYSSFKLPEPSLGDF